MATPPGMFHELGGRTKGSGVRQTVKDHLLASQQLLVTSLYNLAPLLDCVLAAGLLSQDNYHEIKAERTPQNKARKLLEIVQDQMDEAGAIQFLECLRECRQQYPRLRNWLNTETDIQRGPTEQLLQAQFSSLCSRLGFSVLPISLALFSNSTFTQFDLERIQAAPTPTEQSQTLLSICLTKGETACKSFYTALYNEDQQLAEDMNDKVSNLVEGMPSLSLNCDLEVSSVSMAVEETSRSAGDGLPYLAVLQQARVYLGVAVGDDTRLNVCELGVAVGLPRWTIRECLLEGVSIDDASQLEALVSLFMEKTQDSQRLLCRVEELGIQRVQLSERGCSSLKLLQEAEALLRSGSHSHRHTWDHLHDEDHLHSLEPLHDQDCRDQCKVWAIFSFLVWDCLTQSVDEPEHKPNGGLLAMLQQLKGCERVEPELLQEVEQCWQEGGAENLLQSVRVLAQILRDLYPFEDCLHLSGPIEGVYSCKPCRLHRVTAFKGVSARIIRKALRGIAPDTLAQDATPLARQYREVCVHVARLLDTVQPERGTGDLPNAPIAQVTQNICLTLSKPTFRSQAFDAGVRHRLLSLAEFNPARLGSSPLMQLHQETLSDLQRYLQPGEHHGNRFLPESVRILGQSRLLLLGSVRGPVAIDNGVEEDFRFITSEPGCFLVRLRFFGFEKGKGRFEVGEPCCVLATRLREGEGMRAIRLLEGQILGEEDDKIWMRDGGSGWREQLQTVAARHSFQIEDEGCCFRVTTSESTCVVRFIYRSGRLWATAQRYCEVI